MRRCRRSTRASPETTSPSPSAVTVGRTTQPSRSPTGRRKQAGGRSVRDLRIASSFARIPPDGRTVLRGEIERRLFPGNRGGAFLTAQVGEAHLVRYGACRP